MDRTIRFTVSLPEELLQTLDRKTLDQGYSSRSEFIRDLIREKIVEEKWSQKSGEVVGVLTLVYDHHQTDLLQRMVDIQHREHLHILCSTHVHVDHQNCLETIMIRGKPAEIESISVQIGGLRGVKFSKLTRTVSF